jgi:hypothetical protein
VALKKLINSTQKDNQIVLADPSGRWIYLVEKEVKDLDISKMENSYLII